MHSITCDSRKAFSILAFGVLCVAIVYGLAGVWRDGSRAAVALATLSPATLLLWSWSIRLVWTDDIIYRTYLFGAIGHTAFALRDLRRICVSRSPANRVIRVTLHFPTGKVRFWALQGGFHAALKRVQERQPYLYRFATREWC